MEENITFKTLKEIAEAQNYRELRTELAKLNEVDISEFLELLSAKAATVVFRTLPKDLAVGVFSHLDSEMQQYIIESITDQELSIIVEDLFVDDVVDLLEELPANMVKRVLKNASPNTRALINQFLQYPEDSAGSVMTAEFTDLHQNMTVSDAIRHIRCTGENRETIYTCYIIDEQRVLNRVVTVKDLLLSRDDQSIAEIMSTDVISAYTTDDREDVAKLFSKYDLLSVPVVDRENRLVGIITVDDAVDVMETEVTEDFEKMAAMAPSERPYLKTGVIALAKNRIFWLMALMISGMITGEILGKYEAAFAAIPILVTFIPMLTDTGGNAGSQSSTLVIRGMALSEIKKRDLFTVLWKEVRVGVLVGVVLGLVNYVRLIIMHPGSNGVALAVAIALFATVVMAKSIGGALPIFAKIFKVDPAIMAAPLITTVVDAFSLIIYFSLAELFLKL